MSQKDPGPIQPATSNARVPDYERLGVFYLGREYDLSAGARREDLVLYGSKDLVTHAVCVGMTGSGKTGLCIGLLEEAAIDGVPAIVIDPKGDLSNLLLTFPGLSAAEFAPWVNAEDARAKGMTVEEYAAAQAGTWAKGLAAWDQDGARVARLKGAAEFAVYTPGSSAGRQVSLLRSFDPPEGGARGMEPELLRERVDGVVSGLLALLGVEGDPMTSREHLLLSAILTDAWGAGAGGAGGGAGVALDMGELIRRVQTPPVSRVGVMELESFYPAKERFGLALRLNNVVAAPGFARWTTGEPLDVGAMLRGPTGKPRVSVFSIAHLSDAERMFFVSLLLSRVVTWTRAQSGTSSLRAVVYMDEIAGYFPPVANPPSKGPLLTLMKQARAFGVGVVLATQNPVDLDYKGLANAGTWFIGRLQTERDKERVLDGLEGAVGGAGGGGFDRAEMDRLLSGLKSRVFLMNNVHESGPVVFETRWCLSYLRGPLTREQLRGLAERGEEAESPARPIAAAADGAAAAAGPEGAAVLAGGAGAGVAPKKGVEGGERPVLPPEVPQFFIPARKGGAAGYVPRLLGTARVYYNEARLGIEEEVAVSWLCPIGTGAVAVDFDHAEEAGVRDTELLAAPEVEGVGFGALPVEAARAKSYEGWKKRFAEAVFRGHSLKVWRNAGLGLVGEVGEAEGAFRARVAQAVREVRDGRAEELRAKFSPKMEALRERHRRALQRLEVEKAQAQESKVGSALSFGSAVLSAFMGRKAVSAGSVGKAATAVRSASRVGREAADVSRAEENAGVVAEKMAELEKEFRSRTDALGEELAALGEGVEEVTVKPKKTGVMVRAVVLAWAPVDAAGARAW